MVLSCLYSVLFITCGHSMKALFIFFVLQYQFVLAILPHPTGPPAPITIKILPPYSTSPITIYLPPSCSPTSPPPYPTIFPPPPPLTISYIRGGGGGRGWGNVGRGTEVGDNVEGRGGGGGVLRKSLIRLEIIPLLSV